MGNELHEGALALTLRRHRHLRRSPSRCCSPRPRRRSRIVARPGIVSTSLHVLVAARIVCLPLACGLRCRPEGVVSARVAQLQDVAQAHALGVVDDDLVGGPAATGGDLSARHSVAIGMHDVAAWLRRRAALEVEAVVSRPREVLQLAAVDLRLDALFSSPELFVVADVRVLRQAEALPLDLQVRRLQGLEEVESIGLTRPAGGNLAQEHEAHATVELAVGAGLGEGVREVDAVAEGRAVVEGVWRLHAEPPRQDGERVRHARAMKQQCGGIAAGPALLTLSIDPVHSRYPGLELAVGEFHQRLHAARLCRPNPELRLRRLGFADADRPALRGELADQTPRCDDEPCMGLLGALRAVVADGVLHDLPPGRPVSP
mmetsp:Transcript_29906/g.86035  ORF Transcript_29906/g.86035 Transcript_29906/m.86035 type:complete len:374 (+) Transcript_29906:245-1366(+)